MNDENNNLRKDEAINHYGKVQRVRFCGGDYHEGNRVKGNWYLFYDQAEVYHIENKATKYGSKKELYAFGSNSYDKALEKAKQIIERLEWNNKEEKIEPNITFISSEKARKYRVKKMVNGKTRVRTFRTLEEAKTYLSDIKKNGVIFGFMFPETLIESLDFDERADISYIENHIEENLDLALKTIPERSANIFKLAYKYGYTAEAIGLKEGITGARVSQIVRKTLRRLRFPQRKNILQYGQEYFDLQENIEQLKVEFRKKIEELKYKIANPETIEIKKDDLIEYSKIEKLDLSVRSYNCLKRARINTIGELTQKTEEEMMRVRNLGRKSLKEVKEKLFQVYGMTLKKEGNEEDIFSGNERGDNMNKVILIGNITKDIELKQSNSGKSFCNFTLAVKKSFKNNDGSYDADFINCVAFGKTAELLNSYMSKGSKLLVEGQINTNSYKDKDGIMKYQTNVSVERIEFLESKNTKEQQTNQDDITPNDFDTSKNEEPKTNYDFNEQLGF